MWLIVKNKEKLTRMIAFLASSLTLLSKCHEVCTVDQLNDGCPCDNLSCRSEGSRIDRLVQYLCQSETRYLLSLKRLRFQAYCQQEFCCTVLGVTSEKVGNSRLLYFFLYFCRHIKITCMAKSKLENKITVWQFFTLSQY